MNTLYIKFPLVGCMWKIQCDHLTAVKNALNRRPVLCLSPTWRSPVFKPRVSRRISNGAEIRFRLSAY